MLVRHNHDEHRYEAVVDGELVGFTVYLEREDRFWFVHTEIDPEHEGSGIGSGLVRGALDDMREKGALIVPTCPFVAAWLSRHEEYMDLVDRETLREYKRKRAAEQSESAAPSRAEAI